VTRDAWLEDARLEDALRPLALAAMIACLAVASVDLAHLFAPDWNGAYFVVACVLASLEATLSFHVLRARGQGGGGWRFRVAEFALFFLLLKAGRYVGQPWAAVQADVSQWSQDLFTFLDGQTVVAFMLVFFAWDATNDTLRDFARLGAHAAGAAAGMGAPQPAAHAARTLDLGWLDEGIDRPALERVTRRFFWGAALLLVLTGVTRLGLARLLQLDSPPVPGLVINVLVYFGLGLALLGQLRFASLRREWQSQGVALPGYLAWRWVRYSLAFLGLAAAIAFVLPTGYSLGPLSAVATLVGWLAWLIALIVFVLMLPLLWLAALLGGLPFTAAPPAPPAAVEPGGLIGSGGPAWVQVISSFGFWALIAVMVLYVVRSYTLERPELAALLALITPLRWLRAWGAALRRWARGRVRVAPGEARAAPAPAQRAGPAVAWLRPRGARERVLFYYTSVLQRAAAAGLSRRAAQTPGEYRETLGAGLPEAREAADTLTAAFVEARYSAHAVDAAGERRARGGWQRLRQALHGVRR
jgi:hypothetical protein